MEKIRKTLADSKAARWTALAVVAFTMLCGYYPDRCNGSFKAYA